MCGRFLLLYTELSVNKILSYLLSRRGPAIHPLVCSSTIKALACFLFPQLEVFFNLYVGSSHSWLGAPMWLPHSLPGRGQVLLCGHDLWSYMSYHAFEAYMLSSCLYPLSSARIIVQNQSAGITIPLPPYFTYFRGDFNRDVVKTPSAISSLNPCSFKYPLLSIY